MTKTITAAGKDTGHNSIHASNVCNAFRSERLPSLLCAGLLARGWPSGALANQVHVPVAGNWVQIGQWAVSTVVERDGPPPGFGEHEHCDPRRRCVNCHIACRTEALLQQVHDFTGLTPLVFTIGGSLDEPTWMRAALWLPKSPYLSGTWIPAISTVDNGIALVSPERTEVILPTPEGVDVRHVADGVVEHGHREQAILRSLPKMWATILSAVASGHCNMLSGRRAN